MAHIKLPEGLPGIRGAMAFRPETARPLNDLVEILLHGPNSLTPGERELIATYVSSENDCYYCQTIHGAVAAASLDGDEELVKTVKVDFMNAAISEKLKALLAIVLCGDPVRRYFFAKSGVTESALSQQISL